MAFRALDDKLLGAATRDIKEELAHPLNCSSDNNFNHFHRKDGVRRCADKKGYTVCTSRLEIGHPCHDASPPTFCLSTQLRRLAR
jgi:hypothetical protein